MSDKITNLTEELKILEQIAAMANLQPYAFFSAIMNKFRDRFIMAAGPGAILPIDEFMTMALAYERTTAGGLTGFLRWFLDGENEIKRDMEPGSGVRIMTTHSSKGLEAPVVFLIDTTRNPASQNTGPSLKVMNPTTDSFITRIQSTDEDGISIHSATYNAAKEHEMDARYAEYWRLMYVAMTRARDRLYIYGCEERGSKESWHSKLYEAMKNMPGAVVDDDWVINYQTPGQDMLNKTKNNLEVKNHIHNNNKLINEDKVNSLIQTRLNNNSRNPNNNLPIGILPATELDNFDVQKLQKFAKKPDEQYAKSYGNYMHRELQCLDPTSDLAARIMLRPELARFWNFPITSGNCKVIINELGVSNCKIEVPIAGYIDGIFHSFRIDRLIENRDKYGKIISVEFLDYKTDRNKSRRDEYANKMQQYAAMLTKIYPNIKITGQILWVADLELEEIINDL